MTSTTASRRTRTILIACVAAVLAIVLLLVVAPWRDDDSRDAGATGETSDTSTDGSVSPNDSSSPALTGSASAPPTTAPASQDAIDIDDAVRVDVEDSSETLVDEVFNVTVPIDPEEEVDLGTQLAGVVSDTYLSELEAERLEFEAEGWTRTGSFQIGTIEILDHQDDGDGSTATVRVCVDSSDVVVTNADGADIAGPSGNTAWNIFVLTKPADSENWILVGRTFPDDPAC